ncbi:MAG: VanZ family protein [Candidatus Cloacimonas sp.]|nr:VanZ family protein [Candidatus Cloacimonadota bacterium]
MKDKRKVKMFRAIFIIWCALILIGTIIPGKRVPLKNDGFSDKIAHFFQYLVFSTLLSLVYRFANRSTNETLKTLIILSLTLPILNEVIQLWIPNRSFSVLDMVANFIGFLVVIIYLFIKDKIRKKSLG